MNEIWKDIVGYEGQYQVSNLGNVRSLDRIVPTRCDLTRIQYGRIMNKTKTRFGYERVVFCDGNRNHKEKAFLVHRLVAEAFIPNPHNKPQVNHIDSNRQNNCVTNLEWVTAKENSEHCIRVGRFKTRKGKKLSEEQRWKKQEGCRDKAKRVIQMSKDGDYIAEYRSAADASEILFGKKISHIASCCRGTRNFCGGYRWKYKD